MSLPAFWWLVLGIVLMLSELILPGLVTVFLGSAAVLVAAGLYFGLIEGFMMSLTLWFVSSIFLLLTLRQVAARFLPSETNVKHIHEDVEAIGEIVQVVQQVVAETASGRIRFQGTDWPARTDEGEIPDGAKARIKFRDNISWIVEPYTE